MLFRKIFLLIIVSASLIFPQQAPKLVVGIVVDQMRFDYLYRFYNNYSEYSFKKLMNEGSNFTYAHLNYIPSTTAPGHATIYTGTRSEEHTSELQSLRHLVCRLLLEK